MTGPTRDETVPRPDDSPVRTRDEIGFADSDRQGRPEALRGTP